MKHKFIDNWSTFILNETLKTHDIDITINKVTDELSLMRFNFEVIKNNNNSISIRLNNFNNINGVGLYLDVLNRLLIDRHGWFPTKMEITNLSVSKNMFPYNEEILIGEGSIYFDNVNITYEAKYDIEFNIPPKLYHLSISQYELEVLKWGLVPKSKSKLSKHLDRIYVCVDPKDCYNLIPRMKFHYANRKLNNKKDKLNDKWIIWEIDTSDLNIKLYKDPNYEGGYYIVDNISPERIKIFEKE